jgi:hypothetical protein
VKFDVDAHSGLFTAFPGSHVAPFASCGQYLPFSVVSWRLMRYTTHRCPPPAHPHGTRKKSTVVSTSFFFAQAVTPFMRASASPMASTSTALGPMASRSGSRRGLRGICLRQGLLRCVPGGVTTRVDAADGVRVGGARSFTVRASASSSSGETTTESQKPTQHKQNRPFRFCIDRGGTFTDVYAEVPGPTPGSPPSHRTLKLLSEDPANYESAPREGIRRVLESVLGVPIPRNAPVPTEKIEWIRMGTTVATNALLERKGARTALVVTKGFSDLLKIGNQSRPDIFDLRIDKPSELYEQTVEVDERVRVLPPDVLGGAYLAGDSRVTKHTTTGESILVEKSLDLEALRPKLRALLRDGVKSLAVVLLHSYVFPDHEKEIGELATELGFEQVSLSSQLVPMVRAVPRGHTASVDAYLTPKTKGERLSQPPPRSAYAIGPITLTFTHTHGRETDPFGVTRAKSTSICFSPGSTTGLATWRFRLCSPTGD